MYALTRRIPEHQNMDQNVWKKRIKAAAIRLEGVMLLGSMAVVQMHATEGSDIFTKAKGMMNGIYADQKGAVHSFSGTRVTQTYAQQNPESCVRLDDTTYLKIHEGSSNRAVNAYANATTFKNGTFQNKYDTKTHLNNDGSVGDGT